MDKPTEKWIEEIKSKIENSTNEELMDIELEEGKKFGIYGKGNKTIYSIPREYFYDLKLTLNETLQFRKIEESEANKKRMIDDDVAIRLGSSQYRRIPNEVLNNFDESDEVRKKSRELQRKARQIRRKNQKRDIKNKPQKPKKNTRRFKKTQNKTGKKIRNIIIALGLSTVLITSGAQGISRAYADSMDYDYVASTVENLNDDEIAKKAENMIKEEISKATGEKVEDISISDSWRDSSSYVTKIRAGEQEYTYLEDLRGGDIFGENTMSKSIYQLVSEMNNVKGKDRKEVIKALKKSMDFSKNKDIEVKNGKLVEIDESTKDSAQKSGEER